MIFWRGLGILALLFIGLGVGIGYGLNPLIGGTARDTNLTAMGLGFLLANVPGFFIGQWLNVQRPEAQVQSYAGTRWAEYQQLVQQGRFQLSPGHPAPRSLEEGYAQAQHLLNSEVATLQKRARNRHTFMFIPMQWFSAAVAVVGLGLVIAGLVKG